MNFKTDSLNNGLLPDENAILTQTVHIDQAMTLILRGLFRHFGGGTLQKRIEPLTKLRTA